MAGKPDNELRGFVFQKLFLLVAGEVREAQVFVFLPASDTEITAVKISVYHGSPHKIIDGRLKLLEILTPPNLAFAKSENKTKAKTTKNIFFMIISPYPRKK